jgi:hypothetical protein
LFKLAAGALVHDSAEAGEHLQFQELRVRQPQRLGQRAQGGGLGLAAHPRHTLADVDGGMMAPVKQLGVQANLPIGYRDEVGRDVGAQVSRLSLSYR